MVTTVGDRTQKQNSGLKMGISTIRVTNADTENPVCKYCNGKCVKAGKERSGKQRFKCTSCCRRQVAYYDNHAYNDNTDENIIALTKEGAGISSSARLLNISPTTLLSRIRKIADKICEPVLAFGKEYEVDELRTFVKKK